MHLYHLHSQKIERILHSNFWMFETSIWLHILGRSLVAIFIPIIFLSSGFDINSVVLFYFIFYTADVPLNLLARYFVIKYGARITIIIATLFSILFFIFLGKISLFTQNSFYYVGLLGLLTAFYDSFYFVSHLFLFMEIEQKEKNTKSGTGLLYAIKRLGVLLGPLVGAAFLIFVSESALLWVSIFVLLLSIIPLFKLHQLDDKPKKVEPIQLSKLSKKEKFIFINYSIWIFHLIAEFIIWPIFIFMVFETIQSVAFVSAIASISSIIFSYFIGKMNKKKSYYFILASIVIIFLMWLGRMFFENNSFYYVSVIIVGFLSLFVSIPLESDIFALGANTNPLNISTIRNMSAILSGSIFFGILLLFINIFHMSFLIASFSVFFLFISILISYKKYYLE